MGLRTIKPSELREKLKTFSKRSKANLYSTCHNPIDSYYQVLLGSCTDITGYPYSGKTLFLLEILVNLSEKYGLKHKIYMPDSGDPEEVAAQIVHKYTGRTFDDRYPGLIGPEEIDRGIDWMDSHFDIITKNDKERLTPYEFWDDVAASDYHTGVIDSWNFMKHEKGTEYLAEVLSYRNELAQNTKKHFFNIIHPKNPTAQDYNKDGILKAPTVHNLMGGSEWNNNGKSIIVVHKSEKEGLDYTVYFRKTKPRIVGMTGKAVIKYDITKARFFTEDTYGNRVYSNDFEVMNFKQDTIQLQPNTEFDEYDNIEF
jgi:hypothetical protein